MPVEPRLELSAVIGLQHHDAEWESLSDFVQEPNSGALITPVVDLENAYPGAVIDGGELIKALLGPWDTLKELQVHLQAVTGLGLLIALPALTVRPVLLVGR